MHGNCKCGHHWCAKVLVVLAWVSAILFWWTGWKDVAVWGTNADGFFKAVVVFVLLAFTTKYCGCCAKYSMGKSGASCACGCGECNGGKCGGMHNEGHRHM